MQSNYKPIGNYIRLVDERNTDLKAETLLGINIDKFFMPSVANIVGTDLSRYKTVKKNQFACNRMHVGRDYRIPISLSNKDVPFIVSPAYDVFEIKDTEILLPEYLMMWFSRKEFDRNAWFYTDADVRGGLSWKAFENMPLPVPSLSKQREMVAEYNIIQNRITLNNQLIQKLEETAQTIYKQWFVDFEFPDENGKPYKSNGGEMEDTEMGEVPRGWKIKPFTEVLKINGGGTPSTDIEEYWNGTIPFFTPADISNGYYTIDTEKHLSNNGLDNCNSKLYKKNTTFVTARGTVGAVTMTGCEMAMNQSCYAFTGKYEYYAHQLIISIIEKLKREAVGAVFSALITKDFEQQNVIISDEKAMAQYNKQIENIYYLLLTKEQQNRQLKIFTGLLLAKMAKNQTKYHGK